MFSFFLEVTALIFADDGLLMIKSRRRPRLFERSINLTTTPPS